MPDIFFRKVLSSTDTSESATHQGGVLVPKGCARRPPFPRLDPKAVNPDAFLHVISAGDGGAHQLRFVHYNTKLHANVSGSRDEFRLVQLRPLLRSLGPVTTGNALVIEPNRTGELVARLER